MPCSRLKRVEQGILCRKFGDFYIINKFISRHLRLFLLSLLSKCCRGRINSFWITVRRLHDQLSVGRLMFLEWVGFSRTWGRQHPRRHTRREKARAPQCWRRSRPRSSPRASGPRRLSQRRVRPPALRLESERAPPRRAGRGTQPVEETRRQRHGR